MSAGSTSWMGSWGSAIGVGGRAGFGAGAGGVCVLTMPTIPGKLSSVGPVAQLVRAGDSSINGAFAPQDAKWTG